MSGGNTFVGRGLIGEAQLIPHCPSCARAGADFRCCLCHGKGFYLHCTQCDLESRDKHARGHRVMLAGIIDTWICESEECEEATKIELLEIQGMREDERQVA